MDSWAIFLNQCTKIIKNMIYTNSDKYLLKAINHLLSGFSIPEVNDMFQLTVKIIHSRSPALAIFDGHTLSETLEKAAMCIHCSDMVAIMTLHHKQKAPSINDLAYLTQFCGGLSQKNPSDRKLDIKWVVGASPICVPDQVITIFAFHNLKNDY